MGCAKAEGKFTFLCLIDYTSCNEYIISPKITYRSLTQQTQLLFVTLFIILNLIHILQWRSGILGSHARSELSVWNIRISCS
jgi:hypothetical protein